MSNAFVSRQNWMWAATPGVTCDQSAAATMPLSYLHDQRIDLAARILATGFTLTIDLTVARSIRGLLIPRTNLTTAATRRFKIGTSFGAGDVYDDGSLVAAGIVDPIRQLAIAVPSGLTGRWLSLQIADAGNADGFVDLPEMWAGPADIEPAIGIDWGAQLGPQFRDDVARADDGTAWTFQRRALRSWRLQFNWLTNAEASAMLDLQLLMTGARPVLVMPTLTQWSDIGRRAVLGLLAGGQPFTVVKGDRTAGRSQTLCELTEL